MSDFPFLLTRGLEVYWAALAIASLSGPPAAWLLAQRRARASAKSSWSGGSAGELLEATPEGGEVVLEGIFGIEPVDASEAGVSSAGPALLVQEAPRAGRAPARPAGDPYLEIGGERIAILGEIDVASGSRDRWGFRRAWKKLPSLSPVELRLEPGARIRARGRLVPVAPGEVDGSDAKGYRLKTTRPFVLRPRRDGERAELAALRPRARLEAKAALLAFALAAASFFALTWIGGKLAGERAWSIAHEADGDLAEARRALFWASLGAATPSHRAWSLNAAGAALSIVDVKDPEVQRDFAVLSAHYERFRTGGCKEALDWLERGTRYRAVAEVGEECGTAPALRAAARARMKLGEFEAASDLLERGARAERSRGVDQVWLEVQANLLAGRLAGAEKALREVSGRTDEFYKPKADKTVLSQWLPCAADALAARAGDEKARGRLAAATFAPKEPAASKDARGLCGLLLADLLEGPARLAVTDRIRADAGIEPYSELALLELEADPRRADARHVFLGIIHPAWTLAGKSAFFALPSPLTLRAFRRLAAEADPPPAVRRERLNLASGAVSFAAISGLEAESLDWVGRVDRDLEALRASGERIAAAHLDAASTQRAYVELRAGRPGVRPRPAEPSEKADLTVQYQEWRRELEGVTAYVETGSLGGLKEPFELGTFGRRRGERDDVFTGLEIAARGSGEEFAAWLEERIDHTALPAAIVGAPRIRTGKEAMLAWLRKGPEYDLGGSTFGFGERIAAAATRARIAEILGDAALSADFRALAKRLREGLFRRDTGLVLHLLGVR